MTFNKKEIINYITSKRQNDGGFHFANIEPSSGSDTFYAVKVLSMLGERVENPEEIYKFFEQTNAEGSVYDITGLYFMVESLKTLKTKMPKQITKLNLEDVCEPK